MTDTASYSFIDAHLHFDAYEEAGEVDDVVGRARAAGVEKMVAIGGTAPANRLAVELAARYPDVVYATVGYDRDEAGKAIDLATLREQVIAAGVKGVGETGLDYHYSADTAPAQRALFEAMLEVAVASGRPVVVHSREADEDTLEMLGAYAGRRSDAGAGRLGVLHCFTGSWPFAQALLDLGFYISFSGILTFKKAEALRAVARRVPLERLLIETDAPYLAPAPFRGKRNEPAWVTRVAACLAEIREEDLEEIARVTTHNAEHLFQLT